MRCEVNGETVEPEGNMAGGLGALLQGSYRCRGEDNWVAVTVPDGVALSALASVLGIEETSEPANVGLVEDTLASWSREQEAWEAMRRLQEAGVPAGVVSKGKDLVDLDPHLKARKAFTTVQHEELGPVQVIKCPIVLDGEPLTVRKAAPLLGEHTEYVLREILSLSEEEYLDCAVNGVV